MFKRKNMYREKRRKFIKINRGVEEEVVEVIFFIKKFVFIIFCLYILIRYILIK